MRHSWEDRSRGFHILKVVQLLSEVMNPLCQATAEHLAQSVPSQTLHHLAWQEQERLLDRGDAHVAFLCGLLFTKKASALQPLVAPVMKSTRYQNRPIYFSDVVVRAESHFQSFADLEGARWAYNEPGSYSGYAVVQHHLATLGKTDAYFSRIMEAGSHVKALHAVLRGEADGAAIDSTVLDLEPTGLEQELRVLCVLGPSPSPPLAVHRSVPAEQTHVLQEALLTMHEHPAGRAALNLGGVSHWVRAQDADYDSIRQKAAIASHVRLAREHHAR